MKQVLYINASRDGYAIGQIKRTMTVGELVEYFGQFDEESPVYLKHDGGYTYGGITFNSFEDDEVEDEAEDNDE